MTAFLQLLFQGFALGCIYALVALGFTVVYRASKVINFAHDNGVVVVQDAAHILLSYDNAPLSFLQVDGAREVGVEVHSLSKGFNMIGWRMAFVAGHPKIVQAFADVKDNCDSGQFMAIQQAAATALDHPEISDRIREKYRRRLEKLVKALSRLGFAARMPGGTYFLYVRAPKSCGSVLTPEKYKSWVLIRA